MAQSSRPPREQRHGRRPLARVTSKAPAPAAPLWHGGGPADTTARRPWPDRSKLFDISDAASSPSGSPPSSRLYLLFNEGYRGASPQFAVREALCDEAVRLARLLQESPLGETPSTDALVALMHLNAAPARAD